MDEEDDAVNLDPAYLIEAAGDYATFVSDQLQFTGFDLGSARRSEPQEQPLDDISVADYEDQWEIERQRYATHLRAIKERDKALVKSANEKLRRAREKGKGRASLNPDEIEALERRRLQDKQDEGRKERRTSAKSSRNSSSADLHVDKTRRKSGNRSSGSPLASSSRSRGPRSPKQSRSPPIDATTPTQPPGFLIPGPDERPVYAPISYFPPQSGYRSTSDARPSSSETPPGADGPYVPYSPRYFTPQHYRSPSGTKPSHSSRRSQADELHMPPSRARASSSVQHSDSPRAQGSSYGRRNVSGPAEMAFSRLRQMDLASPLYEHPSQPHTPNASQTDIAYDLDQGLESSGSMESVVVVNEESSASDEGDEQGVRVTSSAEREPYKHERASASRAKDKGRRRKR
ncbi:hypothetical protein K461DRAFT_289943 [Myriangium duriaei CBS 260.36]|uniref:Uncharacterized protein n=1 Tax=Myriangium duriaei CBS 260.36 TaxID=1168546 RepID=A0A9P4J9V0_9PEZI|nr:hypothetical protein K461DRAFT_289943 [Myriangium duriaei CBS 260.36]